MRQAIQRVLEFALPRRVTSRGDYLAAIDGLRFLALASVVLFHLNGYFLGKTGIVPKGPFERAASWLFSQGHCGVTLFFVISGFILGLPFVVQHAQGGPRVSLRKYFLRRLTRLEPPYVVSLLLAAVLVVIVRGETVSEVLRHLGAHLVYLHELVFREGGLNSVTWSLEIEVQFYLLVPLLALSFKLPMRLRRPLFLAAILAFGGLSLAMGRLEAPRTILSYLHLFLCGLLLADLHLHAAPDAAAPDRGARWRDAIGTVLLLSLPLLIENPITNALLAPLVMTGAYACVLRGGALKRFFESLVISRIGGMCYSGYLLHVLVIAGAGRLLVHRLDGSYAAGLARLALLCLPPILLATLVFFRAIELPCMRPDWPARLAATVRRMTTRPRRPSGEGR